MNDLWMYDLERGTESRFTFHQSYNDTPVWSPDGSQVVFASARAGVPNLYVKAANGTGQEQQVFKSDAVQFPTDWSRDGRFIILESIEANSKYDVMALPITGDRKPIPLLQSEFNERDGRLSPDGKWLAYASDETGRYEVYVQPFTVGAASGMGNPTAGKWQVSKTGAIRPQWSSDNKELYFETIDGTFAAVEVAGSSAGFSAGSPQALAIPPFGSILYANYAVSRDGKRFLVNTSAGEAVMASQLTVIVNWLAGIRK
jgi:Tol biopolymer transport system component